MDDTIIGFLMGIAVTLGILAFAAKLFADELDRQDAGVERPAGAVSLVPGLDVRVTDLETGDVFYGSVYREAPGADS